MSQINPMPVHYTCYPGDDERNGEHVKYKKEVENQ